MPEEIESRYVVPDRAIFRRLSRATDLAGFQVASGELVRMEDTYLDTRGRALMHQGWALRLRRMDEATIVTLKGPGHVDGSIMGRAQWEMPLTSRGARVERWPESELRSRLLDLTGGSGLVELVRLRQRRRISALRDGDRTVAELALDVVEVAGRVRPYTCLMLEAELAPEATTQDLERLDGVLISDYGLVPESRSKVQLALAWVETGQSPEADLWERVQPAPAEVIARRYGVNTEAASRAVAIADRLYELLCAPAGSDGHEQQLLRAAAQLHGIVRDAPPKRQHAAARDILLRQRIIGLSESDRPVLCAAISLHRGQLTPARIEAAVPADWAPELRRLALHVAAVLRMAVALAPRLPPSASLLAAQPVIAGQRLIVSAEAAEVASARRAARRAAQRSDLWGLVTSSRLEWAVARVADDDQAVPLAVPVNVLGLNAWDPMPRAAFKILAFYAQQMLDHEPGTRLGLDPEELHAMRVATRRLRSALRLLGPYLDAPLAGPASDSLRRLAQALGGVRDMDVALIRVGEYLENAPDQAQDMAPLVSQWRAHREARRRQLIRYLDSRAYTLLRQRLLALLEALQSAEGEAPPERQVGQVAPRMVYLAWQAVIAYTAVLPQAPPELLHLLRIDSKRLRYALECYGEVLPAGVASLVGQVVGLQDHLGAMRDETIAIGMLDAYLARARGQRTREAVLAYRAACEETRQALTKSFAPRWEQLTRGRAARALQAYIEREIATGRQR